MQGDVGDRAFGVLTQQIGGALEAHPTDEGVQRLPGQRRVEAVKVIGGKAGGAGDLGQGQGRAEVLFDVVLGAVDAALVLAA